ncbi:MAG: DUF1588 domain-containing protein, partial [Planctomycetes bacterium]|nr:DUF1588 domain-containing protein [Planctomycetota bacterium]
VENILEKDQDVFKELLTTDKFYLYHSGDNEATTKAVNKHKDVVQTIIKDFHSMEPKKFLAKHKRSFSTYLNLSGKSFNKKPMEFLKEKIDTIQSNPSYTPVAFGNIRHGGRGMGRSVNRTTMFNIDPYTWSYEPVQPFKIPNRMGILTHPVWLVAHSLNTSTDPVKRGKWIREKLLAGFIPDVPITVDAAIPENHHQTLRQRLHDKTKDKACWKCHESMNPLGYAFEMYDDFGRYRTAEELEYPEHIVFKAPDKGQYIRNKYKTLPLDTRGYLDGTGDHKLDGEVENAIDLITRLAKSDRVRQSIIRHVFRYFMGRNEMLSDSQTLINADKAYVKSGGSFNALIVSLLTSDSFMYRKETKE